MMERAGPPSVHRPCELRGRFISKAMPGVEFWGLLNIGIKALGKICPDEQVHLRSTRRFSALFLQKHWMPDNPRELRIGMKLTRVISAPSGC